MWALCVTAAKNCAFFIGLCESLPKGLFLVFLSCTGLMSRPRCGTFSMLRERYSWLNRLYFWSKYDLGPSGNTSSFSMILCTTTHLSLSIPTFFLIVSWLATKIAQLLLGFVYSSISCFFLYFVTKCRCGNNWSPLCCGIPFMTQNFWLDGGYDFLRLHITCFRHRFPWWETYC